MRFHYIFVRRGAVAELAESLRPLLKRIRRVGSEEARPVIADAFLEHAVPGGDFGNQAREAVEARATMPDAQLVCVHRHGAHRAVDLPKEIHFVGPESSRVGWRKIL